MSDVNPLEIRAVEEATPAHAMVLMLEQCQKAGLEGRMDFVHKLNIAAAGPLAGLDELTISRTARRIDDMATALLHTLSPDDPAEGLMCCAMFALTLADEGLLLNPRCQAVLVALLLIEDARVEHSSEEAVVRLDEDRWRASAKKMLHRARLLGLYVR